MFYVQSVAHQRAASQLDVKTSSAEHAHEDSSQGAAFLHQWCGYVAHGRRNALLGKAGQPIRLSADVATQPNRPTTLAFPGCSNLRIIGCNDSKQSILIRQEEGPDESESGNRHNAGFG